MEQNFGCHNCIYATGCPLHELVVQGKPLTHEVIKSITQDNESGVLQRTHTLPFGSETPITTILRTNKNSSTVECSLLTDKVKIEADTRRPMQRLGDSLLRFSGRFVHTLWENGRYIASGISELIPRKAYYKGVTFNEWINDTDYFYNSVSSYLDLLKVTSLTDNLAIGNIRHEEWTSGQEINGVAAYPFKSDRLIKVVLEDGKQMDFNSFFELHTLRRNNNIANLRNYSLIQLSDIRKLLIELNANIEDPRMPNVIFVNGPVHITKPLKKFGFMSVREIGDDKNLTTVKLETGEADTLVFALNRNNLTKAIEQITLIQKRINRPQAQTRPYTKPTAHYTNSVRQEASNSLLAPNIRSLVENARREALSFGSTDYQVTEAIRVALEDSGLSDDEIESIFKNSLHT